MNILIWYFIIIVVLIIGFQSVIRSSEISFWSDLFDFWRCKCYYSFCFIIFISQWLFFLKYNELCDTCILLLNNLIWYFIIIVVLIIVFQSAIKSSEISFWSDPVDFWIGKCCYLFVLLYSFLNDFSSNILWFLWYLFDVDE